MLWQIKPTFVAGKGFNLIKYLRVMTDLTIVEVLAFLAKI
jgi:hypothetical protein